MLDFLKRNFFIHINRYQKMLIYPVVVPCLLGCFVILFCLIYLYVDPNTVIFDDEFYILKIITTCIIVSISLILLFMSVFIYFVSNRLVGPHDRIIRELDEILAGGDKKALTARKNDKLFLELLKRINSLLDKVN